MYNMVLCHLLKYQHKSFNDKYSAKNPVGVLRNLPQI